MQLPTNLHGRSASVEAIVTCHLEAKRLWYAILPTLYAETANQLPCVESIVHDTLLYVQSYPSIKLCRNLSPLCFALCPPCSLLQNCLFSFRKNRCLSLINSLKPVSEAPTNSRKDRESDKVASGEEWPHLDTQLPGSGQDACCSLECITMITTTPEIAHWLPMPMITYRNRPRR